MAQHQHRLIISQYLTSNRMPMQLLFICTVLLFTTLCTGFTEQSWYKQVHKRAYQNYGSNKVRGGTATPFSPFGRFRF